MKYLLVFFALLAACGSGAEPMRPEPPKAAAPQPATRKALIAVFQEEAEHAAVDVLREGGTAADAFVAATLVNYVVAPGITSLAGPLGAMVYVAATGEVRCLDAGFDAVADDAGLYDPERPTSGAAVLVPGALRGLEALWKAHGRFAWSRLVEPARKLAEEGFVVDRLYLDTAASRREILERSSTGARVLEAREGEPFRQPELAALLAEIARSGADAFYRGAWSTEFVEVVSANGGAARASDLERYEARWVPPFVGDLRGLAIHANGGRAYGGLYGLLGVLALAADPIERRTEVDRLEIRLRIARALYEDPWFLRARRLDDRRFVDGAIARAGELLGRIRAASPARGAIGSHSLQMTIVDSDGNAVTGTNTINSLPWGAGLFVRGVPLTEAGAIRELVPGPGQRVVSPLAAHIVTDDGRLVFIGATFGSSLLEAQFQILADAVVDRVDPRTSAARVRFGTFVFVDGQTDPSANWIDPAAPSDVVFALEARGLKLNRDPLGDVGFGTFVSGEPRRAAALDRPWFRARIVEVER